MRPVDQNSFSQNVHWMVGTNQCNAKEVFAGVLISMETSCMEPRRMELRNHLARVDQHQVFTNATLFCSCCMAFIQIYRKHIQRTLLLRPLKLPAEAAE